MHWRAIGFDPSKEEEEMQEFQCSEQSDDWQTTT